MAHARKKLPPCPGTGDLKFRGFKGQVDYEVLGDPTSLRPGPNRLRGSFTATPEVAEAAFREGDGELTLDSGTVFRVVMLGHTPGSDTAYFEMRV
jgi:hypothetical protein